MEYPLIRGHLYLHSVISLFVESMWAYEKKHNHNDVLALHEHRIWQDLFDRNMNANHVGRFCTTIKNVVHGAHYDVILIYSKPVLSDNKDQPYP